MVEILDTTLREGEQTPYVNFQVEEKMEIARRLDLIGVEMIEAGDPSVSPNVAAAIEKIAGLKLKAEIVAHSMATRSGIKKASDLGADRVAVFYATSKIHLESKTNRSQDEAIDIVREHVQYARSLGLKVRYTPEDATRTDFDFLVQICNAAIEAGADRISYADTLGIMQPHSMHENILKLREKLLPCKIDLHCHDDLGLALANAMAGIRGGADCIHTTVNSMGERTGIPDLSTTIVAFHQLEGEHKYDLTQLVSLASYVEKVSGFFSAPNKPITGQNAFSHKSGVHTNGVLKNPSTYESINPELVGRERKIVIDKYTGKRAVVSRLEEYGITVSDEELQRIVDEIKNIGDERKLLFDTDIVEIAEQVTGKVIDAIPRDIHAIVQIEAESHIYTSLVVRRMRNFKNVSSVYEITGDYDINSVVKARDVHELNNLIEEIRTIPGVKQTETRLILKKYAVKNGNSKEQ
ncbi:MAG: Lrp/AsnC ligand binding domain-containing protein [Anaerolineales bacterium]|nr:Lrp/AsnC ligand binding domain-containing protein [Anaerolineales bacterium]